MANAASEVPVSSVQPMNSDEGDDSGKGIIFSGASLAGSNPSTPSLRVTPAPSSSPLSVLSRTPSVTSGFLPLQLPEQQQQQQQQQQQEELRTSSPPLPASIFTPAGMASLIGAHISSSRLRVSRGGRVIRAVSPETPTRGGRGRGRSTGGRGRG